MARIFRKIKRGQEQRAFKEYKRGLVRQGKKLAYTNNGWEVIDAPKPYRKDAA